MFLPSISLLACGLSTTFALTYSGLDWSSATTVEQSGISYQTVGGTKEPLEKILVASGVNTVRQRVWVTSGAHGLDYNIALAKRAKAAGLGVYLDFHYTNSWADPVMVSLGNEIRNGLLWPTGRTPSYANIARLLKSAAQGIKDSGLNPQPKIMIHVDNGWNWSQQQSFYRQTLAQGTFTTNDFDIIGVSYYPFYNTDATLASLKSSLTNIANTWGKEIIVAETNWPISCPNPSRPFPSDTRDIPFSEAGQVTWIKKVAAIVSEVKGGTGLFVWEPAWVRSPTLGSSCANNLMFSSSGRALSSMSVFGTIASGDGSGGGGGGGGGSGCAALWGHLMPVPPTISNDDPTIAGNPQISNNVCSFASG
ncbi:hypothetical protein V493_00637 [Pseudogymnoascus sp. VKM F-4281 (FW-2241)]|nr:hypothetical protein V493_00637 [Pseudogymnoascus sp. VKM F-4281 (FW-2241)]